MIRMAFVGGLATMVVGMAVSAEDFPLTFRTIPAKNVMSFPGGSGSFGQLRLVKPADLKKEPKAVSHHPLYGELRGLPAGEVMVVRLDESKGDGKGYDQLIVDMNRNGDLTDDAPASLAVTPNEARTPPQAMRPRLFGPIKTAAGTTIAGGQPIYFAQVFISDLSGVLRSGMNTENLYAGQLQLKAGWYVEATVDLKGRKQKVGVFDGDNDLRLGDAAKSVSYSNPGEAENWYFGPGDSFLVDVNNSGAFESDILDTESSPFGPILYLGAAPCKVALARDGKSLQVWPWTEALAEVALEPNGEQVRSVTLGWERADKVWQLLRPAVVGGKIKVPPGNYRLYKCELVGKGSASRDQVLASAYQRVAKKPLTFAVGEANVLRCGAPLEIKVTAEKRVPQSWELNSGALRDPPLASDSEFVLSINANVQGANTEVYSEYAKGEKFSDEPPQPTFTIVDSSGKQVADGKLEFG